MGSVPCKQKFASRFVEHECALALCCESKCDERRNSGSRTQWLQRGAFDHFGFLDSATEVLRDNLANNSSKRQAIL